MLTKIKVLNEKIDKKMKELFPNINSYVRFDETEAVFRVEIRGYTVEYREKQKDDDDTAIHDDSKEFRLDWKSVLDLDAHLIENGLRIKEFSHNCDYEHLFIIGDA